MSRTSGAWSALVLSAALPAQITLTGAIHDATTGPLKTGETYVLAGVVSVPRGRTLTVQPGAVLKLRQGGSGNAIGNLRIDGTLKAMGTASQPIFITSIHDDTVGKSTATRPPAPADWRQLTFTATSDASVVHFVEVRFAGQASLPSVFLLNTDATLRDVTIRNGARSALDTQGSVPTVERCRFLDCGAPAVQRLSFQALSKFRDNQARGNVGGDIVQVVGGSVTGTHAIGPENGIGGVIVLRTGPTMQGGSSVKVKAGTIFKFTRSATDLFLLRGSAKLEACGTSSAPVVFTSITDDASGGDSLKDGLTRGTAGEWRQLLAVDTQSTISLQHARIRFSGRGQPVIHTRGPLAMRDCVIESALAQGVVSSNASFTIRRTTFRDLGQRPFGILGWQQVANLRDVVAERTGGTHLVITSPRVSGNLAVFRENTINGNGVIENHGASISGTNSLTLGPGLLLKIARLNSGAFLCGRGARLVIEGRGDDPIRMTSDRDDEWGGDTNGDGRTTVPVPGSWRYVQFADGALGSMAWVHTRYGGQEGGRPGTIRCLSGQVRITSTRVDHSKFTGFSVSNVAEPAANWVVWKAGGQDGILLAGGSFTLQHATVVGCTGNGVRGLSGYTGKVFSCIGWNNGTPNSENFFGMSGRIFRTCGTRTGSPRAGNFYQDPAFVNEPAGDLRLRGDSRCVGQADIARATLWGVDADGNSRILDDDLAGIALPDIGAYERFQYRMDVQGTPRIGKTLRFDVGGPGPATGFQVIALGPGSGGVFLPPFGVIITGFSPFLALFTLPPKAPFVLPLPDAAGLVGVRFGVQPIVFAKLSPRVAGNACNGFLGTIRP